MNAERLDLSALDPMNDPERRERLIRSITRRALPELSRRAAENSPIALLASWARPMLAAAAALVIVSTVILALTRERTRPHAPDDGIVEALHIPTPAADWLTEDRGPTVGDLIFALEGDSP